MSDVYEQWEAQDRLIESKIDALRPFVTLTEGNYDVDIEIEHWDRYTDLYSFSVHSDEKTFQLYGTLADLEELLGEAS